MQLNQYGREIKKGIVFAYVCKGRGGQARDGIVYRFGKTTKTKDKFGDGPRSMIERLGQSFSGLNKPEHVVLWEPVTDVYEGWDICRDYLHGRCLLALGSMVRPALKHEQGFGDNFYSLKDHSGPEKKEEFVKQMKAAFAILFTKLASKQGEY